MGGQEVFMIGLFSKKLDVGNPCDE
jgi:hypothetical protein